MTPGCRDHTYMVDIYDRYHTRIFVDLYGHLHLEGAYALKVSSMPLPRGMLFCICQTQAYPGLCLAHGSFWACTFTTDASLYTRRPMQSVLQLSRLMRYCGCGHIHNCGSVLVCVRVCVRVSAWVCGELVGARVRGENVLEVGCAGRFIRWPRCVRVAMMV